MKNLYKKFEIKIKFKKNNEINPHKHWLFIIRSFFVAVVLIIGFSIYLLFEIKNENIFSDNNNEEKPKVLLKENLLKGVNDFFDQKNKNIEDIKNGLVKFNDPSL